MLMQTCTEKVSRVSTQTGIYNWVIQYAQHDT